MSTRDSALANEYERAIFSSYAMFPRPLSPLYVGQGRIMNRFAKDVDMIDIDVQSSLQGWLQTSFTIFGGLIIIVRATPWFMIPLVGIAAIFYAIQQVAPTHLHALAQGQSQLGLRTPRTPHKGG